MKPRSVIMDISIDQGGCVETSRPTTYQNPTYIEEDVIHYCVPNMTGVVARTTTHAFNNAAWPYIQQIARAGTGGRARGRAGPAPRPEHPQRRDRASGPARIVAGSAETTSKLGWEVVDGVTAVSQQALLRRRRGSGDQVAQPRLHDRQLQRAEGAAGRAGAPRAGAGGRGDRPGADHRPGRLRGAGDAGTHPRQLALHQPQRAQGGQRGPRRLHARSSSARSRRRCAIRSCCGRTWR